MYSKIKTAGPEGLNIHGIEVEADISRGLSAFYIVGLGDRSIGEAKKRIRAAFSSYKISWPLGRVTVNLRPAALKKQGGHFDLPIALSILMSMGVIRNAYEQEAFFGELGLDGSILPVDGALAMVSALKRQGVRSFVLPRENLRECSILKEVDLYPVSSLKEVLDYLRGEGKKERVDCPLERRQYPDFSLLRGQEGLKRALLISASGFHSLMMSGPPGTGKSMAAKCLPGILPDLEEEEALELFELYSLERQPLSFQRPFRIVYSNATKRTLLGGGNPPRPGELTFAHRGILFLDEIAEFQTSVIESLRVPMDEKRVILHRNGKVYRYPADTLLLFAKNPCPCGNLGKKNASCKCTAGEIARYHRKISMAVEDRIDMVYKVQDVEYDKVRFQGMSSAEMAERVKTVWDLQKKRNPGGVLNSRVNTEEDFLKTSESSKPLIRLLFEKYALSMRSYQKVLKVARTIADLDGDPEISEHHLLESMQYLGASVVK